MITRIHHSAPRYSAPTSNEPGAFCRVRSSAFAGLAVSAALVAAPGTHAAAPSLPTGAWTVSGAQTVSQSGTTLTVTQTTAKAATNWQSFNVGAGHTVNFVQPSASAVSLNRVIGTDVSVIQGALNANGHVFLLNPNGVLFTKSAQVNVGGIVASTLNMKTEDFMAGRYTFEGAGSGTVVNQGNITAAKGGFVGLIAAKVTNTGSIVAPEGSVVAGAGNRVTLDLGGPIKIKVEEGVLDALIEQGGAIRADGGLVYLTAKAVGEVTRTVLNHTGITEARTLSTGKDGKIYLMGGMKKDRIVVAGKLDASAPNGGNGGFVETSAANVKIADDVRVTTAAPKGKTGTWLIDPVDFFINAGNGASTPNSIGATTLGTALNTTDVTIRTVEDPDTEGNGDIFVNASVTKTLNNSDAPSTTLTLAAYRDIVFAEGVSISGSEEAMLNIVLAARAGEGATTGRVYLKNAVLRSFGGNITIGGGDLQASQHALGRDGLPGVLIEGATIDATLFGESRYRVLSDQDQFFFVESPVGGNIQIKGWGGTWGGGGSSAGVDVRLSLILTGGNASIELAGKGGDNMLFMDPNGGIKLGGSYIQARDGMISLVGIAATTGFNRYGISTEELVDPQIPEGFYPRRGVKIETQGAINIEGDSLAIWNGRLELRPGEASTISAPVLAFSSEYGPSQLISFQAGLLTFTGNAKEWESSFHTRPTNTNGMFQFFGEGPTFQGVTRGQALYAFGYLDQTAVYLRLNAGLSSVYGENPAFTYSLYDASSGGNQIADASAYGNALWSGSPTATSNVGTYTLTYSGGISLENQSYLLNPGGAMLYSVNPRPVTITPDAKTKVYGDADPALTYSVTSGNLVGSDTLIGTLTRAAGNNVGNRLISASGFNGESVNRNYAVTTATGLLTINQRPITITATPKTKIYGDVDPAFTYTVTSGNLVGEESLTGSLTRAAGNNVGVYATSASALLNSENNSNYAITPVNSALTISQRPITITADAKAKVYGDVDPALTYTVTSGNVVEGDTLLGALTRAAGNNAGVYATSASALLNSENNSNYAITPVNSALTISQRPITITAAPKTKVYGDEDPALTYTVTSGNVVEGETLLGAITRAAGNNAGVYATSAVALLDNENNSNYAITSVDSALTINQRPITITADAKTKVYGEVDPALTYAITSGDLLKGDVITGSLTRETGTNAGLYTISVADLANANYAITPVNNTLTISQPPVTATTAVSTVYVVPPIVSRPASAQLNVGLQLVEVAPAETTQSNQTQASGALSFDPVAAAKRAPGTVLVFTGGVKRAADDKESGPFKKDASKR